MLNTEKLLEDHISVSHNEQQVLFKMSEQVEALSGGFHEFSSFKAEMKVMLKSLQDTQNELKQELFLIRTSKESVNQAERAPKKNTSSLFLYLKMVYFKD